MNRLVLVFLVFCSSALAQEQVARDAESMSPSQASSPEISVDLRSEYLLGEPMLVRIDVTNSGDALASFPDLSAEPWRVRFKVTSEVGKSETRYNSPGESESSRVWSLPPRARKQVLLEIPSSGTFRAGSYTLEVEIQKTEGVHQIPPHSFRIASANPVSGEISHGSLLTERNGFQVVWGHKNAEGMALYLNHASAADPSNVLGNYHLLQLGETVEPQLAMSAPQQMWDRHVYWMHSKKSVSHVRLRGHSLRSTPVTLNFPYPEIELVAPGVTDKEGTLHLPFWVSAPNGSGGELRVASVDVRNRPAFRSVLRAPVKPDWIESMVGPTGSIRLLVGQNGALDLYSLPSSDDLPARGSRFVEVGGGALYAQISQLPESDSFGGGLALGVLRRMSDIQSTRLAVSWLSFEGKELMTSEPIDLPEGAELEQALVVGESFWLLYKDAKQRFWIQTPSANPVRINPGDKGVMVPMLDTGISLRRFRRGSVIRSVTP